MFSKLSKSCARLADFRWSADSIPPADGTFTTQEYLVRVLTSPRPEFSSLTLEQPPEANSLSWLSIPAPETTLGSVAGVCGKMLSPLSPIAQYVGDILGDDIDQVVHVLSGTGLEDEPYNVSHINVASNAMCAFG